MYYRKVKKKTNYCKNNQRFSCTSNLLNIKALFIYNGLTQTKMYLMPLCCLFMYIQTLRSLTLRKENTIMTCSVLVMLVF